MMKKFIFLPFLLALIILVILIYRPAKSSGGAITLIGADGSVTHTVTASSELNSLFSNVVPRFKFQYADENRDYSVGPMASGLQSLISQIDNHISFLYADSNRELMLGYPTELINDTTAPQITNITSKGTSSTSVKITWTTNEFSTSTLKYGTQSGSYPQTITDGTYQKPHQVTISGLTTGTTYYYRIVSTDRSGNVTQSAEKTFVVLSFLFLPSVTR